MLHLPDPLHPFAVHFPIVFLLIGSGALVLSLIWPHRTVHIVAALAMVLGAFGAVWAQRTGIEDATAVRFAGTTVVAAVQAHKNIAGLMLVGSGIAAVAASVAYFARAIPGVSLASRLVGVASVVFLLWTMQATLHTGSELTHRYFFGPNAPKPFPGTGEVIRLRLE